MLVSTKAERWSVSNVEILTNDSIDEAMEEYLDDYAEPGDTAETFREALRDLGRVVVTGYARLQVPNSAVAEHGLTAMTEWLEDEYGDPDGSYGDTKLSDATKDAARLLAKSVLADFSVWRMDAVTIVKINALEWVEKNAPEWLKPNGTVS